MRRSYLFLALLFCSIPSQAIDYTVCTKEIADKLKSYGLDCNEAGIYPMKGLMDGKNMEVKTMNGIISSIGVQLIAPEFKNKDFTPVFDFVERYWLELLLCKDELEIQKKLKEDDVDLQLDGALYNVSFPSIKKLLSSIQPEHLSISKTTSMYAITWKTTDEKELSLAFRKRIGFILGMDKRELETYFLYQLQNNVPIKSEPLSPVLDNVSKSMMSDIYIEKGATYLIPEMTSDRYWKKGNDAYTLLYDVNHIPESASNLFTGGYAIPNTIQIAIDQRYYTSETQTYTCSLNQFLHFMNAEKNHGYVGIDKINTEDLTGVVIFENQDFMYNHAVYFKCPVSVIEDSRGVIDLTIYTYIPTHNIETIYDIYEEKEIKKFYYPIQP